MTKRSIEAIVEKLDELIAAKLAYYHDGGSWEECKVEQAKASMVELLCQVLPVDVEPEPETQREIDRNW